MRKVLALLAAVILGTQALYASDFLFMKNIKFYGEGQTIGYSVQNGYDLNIGNITREGVAGVASNYSGVVSFFTAGLTFDIVENITADFSLAYSNNWAEGGNKALSLLNNPNGSAVKGDSIQSYLDNIRVQTANVTIKNLFAVDGLSVKVGRQYYGDEDSSVMYFGVRHYQPLFGLNVPFLGFDSVTSVNAVTFNYDKDNVKANLMYANLGKILGLPLGLENLLVSMIAGEEILDYVDLNKDTTVIGADVKFINLAKVFNLELYGYDIETPFLIDHYSIAGIKPGLEVGGLKASLEFAMNFAGNDPFGTGYIYEISDGEGFRSGGNLIKADLSFDIDKKATVRGSYVVQGGTEGLKESINGEETSVVIKPFINFGNYVPGIVFGQQQVTRLLSMVDFQAINVGVDWNVNKFTFSVDYYNLTARDNGLDYGNEADLKIKYKYIDGLDFFLGIGGFMLADDLKDLTEEQLPEISSSFQLGASYKF